MALQWLSPAIRSHKYVAETSSRTTCGVHNRPTTAKAVSSPEVRRLALVLVEKVGRNMCVRIFWAIVLSVITLNSWAVNKCKTADGKTVFQDAPCMGAGETLRVRPASGSAPPVAASAAPPDGSAGSPSSQAGEPPKGTTYVQQLARAKDERERREKWFEMRKFEQVMDSQIAECSREQQRLASEKNYSKNNLAGATRDVSISNEMQAAASLCGERIKVVQVQLEAAKVTCERIKCIPATQ